MNKSLSWTCVAVLTAAFAIAGCSTGKRYYFAEDGVKMSDAEKTTVCKDLNRKMGRSVGIPVNTHAPGSAAYTYQGAANAGMRMSGNDGTTDRHYAQESYSNLRCDSHLLMLRDK